MKDVFETVKVDLLNKKIREYFDKHPKAQSFILKHNFDNRKTYWKVVKESSSKFNISEVSTQSNAFILEISDGNTGVVDIKPKSKDELDKLDPNRPKTNAGRPDAGKVKGVNVPPTDIGGPKAELPTMSRNTAVKQAQAVGNWKLDNPNSEFAKTLSQTKDLGKTLGAMYQSLSKDKNVGGSGIMNKFGLGGNKKALNVINGYLNPTGVQIKSPKDLQNPAIQKKIGSYLHSVHNPKMGVGSTKNPQGFDSNPAFAKTYPNLPREVKNESKRLTEASAQFATISREFVAAMTPPFDHAKLSKALKDANMMIGKLQDPKELQQAGSMIGALTGIVDSTTAGGGSRLTTQKTVSAKPNLTAAKFRIGKVLREDEAKKKKEDDEEETPEVPEEKPEAPEASDDKEKEVPITKTKEEPEDTVEQEPSEEPIQPKEKTPEEAVLSKSLSGQTITSASIELDETGGTLVLNLAGMKIPARLKWTKGGKVVLYMKDRPYILRHG